MKYMLSAIAVIVHENTYRRYKDCMVLKYAKTVHIQTIRNTHEPMITIMVGRMLFPSPLDAAMEQSMKADME